MPHSHTVLPRFLEYVQIDTQSDPFSSSFPSTEKQNDLGRKLVSELIAMGYTDAEMDANGYVYATIAANTDADIPVLCFCAHLDTAPDCSGTGVKPIVHRNYRGQDIVLPEDSRQVLRVAEHPYLLEKIGDDIVTASGTTLLGADDKAGVAIIMDLAACLATNPAIPHGKIRLLFTPDEEVGRGVDKLDMEKLAADFAYTLDAGEAGSLETENFSADGLTLHLYGIAAHPGAAKGKLVNAIKLAGHLVSDLPDALSPEHTEGREGFIHPVHISGNAEKGTVQFILRDFDKTKLAHYAAMLEEKAKGIVAKYPGARYVLETREQYRNMAEKIGVDSRQVKLAEEAIRRVGLTVRQLPIRGGTDGARLSFMGLPCPNLFTGEMALHSCLEYVSVQDMERSVDMLVELVQLWAVEN